MADQNPNPLPWDASMSDGCSGVFDFWWAEACRKHDKKYYFGGTIEEKLVADGDLHQDMCETPGMGGWTARRGYADVRYTGVRKLTYNYPPGHPKRAHIRHRVEAWNWLGPGLPKGE